MDYKEELIKFVNLKSEIIENITGLKYVDEKDIEDIKSWDNEVCAYIYTNLIFLITQKRAKGLSSSTCVWCLKYNGICKSCGYGYRHGICFEDYSLFDRYRSKRTKKALSNRVYKHMIGHKSFLRRIISKYFQCAEQ